MKDDRISVQSARISQYIWHQLLTHFQFISWLLIYGSLNRSMGVWVSELVNAAVHRID